MGVVYRARDTLLGREVALKVLPEGFAEDAERLARFEREARLLAQLNHPHIAQVHGLEVAGERRALVMELVEGPTLAERLGRGALPLEEARGIARQIAEALEAAHEKGIVHRDLKPQNVKLAREGGVKVLDFGLAKALEPEGGAAAPALTQSPTFTLGGATAQGVILGTAAYMSPEQAKGLAVDKRSDIWAFGCVLYELLSGRRLFEGDSVPDTLAGVLRGEIDLAALPAGVPAAIRRLLRRCLERNPANRLHDIADARLVIEDALTGRGEEGAGPGLDTAPGRRRSRLAGFAALAAGLALAALVGYLAGSGRGEVPAPGPTFERLTFRAGHFINARFGPDGQTAFLTAAWEGRPRELFQVRPKAGDLAVGIAGAELLSISRQGELALLLPRQKSFTPYFNRGTLAVVPASGGTPRELAEEVWWADWAPDGESLAAIRRVGGKYRLEFPLGKVLYESVAGLYWPRVSPRGDAVALMEQNGTFALVLVERSGARRVLSGGWWDWWNLAWSPDGREVWFGGAKAGSASELYAVDLDGRLRTLLSAPGTLEMHDVAPDGRALVALVRARSLLFGRPPGAGAERDLSWLEASRAVDLSADGRRLLFSSSSEREGGRDATYLRPTDGAPAVRLGEGSAQELSRDGRWALAIRDRSLVALPTGAGEPRVLEVPAPSLLAAAFLPDGERALLVTREPGGSEAFAIGGFAGEPLRPLGRPIELRYEIRWGSALSPVSPDGRWVAAALDGGGILLLQLDGSEPRQLPGALPNELPVQWTPDGGALYVYDQSELPARVFTVEVATGRRTLWQEIRPADAAGISGLAAFVVTPDGSGYAYYTRQYLSDLYLVSGLR